MSKKNEEASKTGYANSGRRPDYGPGRRMSAHSVMLTEEHAQMAAAIGHGNKSKGIRLALERAAAEE